MNRSAIDPEIQRAAAADAARALAEDVGDGDLTAALVPADSSATATVTTRESAVICGRPWFDEVFRQLSDEVSIDWLATEGTRIEPGDILCELQGPARALLTGERTALNFLQTLSATATNAHSYAEAVRGTGATILDTRKTLPGLRQAQKYAVRTGGARNHRKGLYDEILIKENHIIAAGGIAEAVQRAAIEHAGVPLEVEVENLDQLVEALQAGARRVLLDNFSLDGMREAVALRDAQSTDALLEASGGVDTETVRKIAETGVDCISVGALTKDVQAIDLSMRMQLG